MVATHDGGQTWNTLNYGCGLNVPILRVTSGGQLWSMCSNLSSGVQRKLLVLSQDGGQHWDLVADSGGPFYFGRYDNLSGDFASDLAVQTRNQAWMLYNSYDWQLDGLRSVLQLTTDGGRTWQEPIMHLEKAASERIDRVVFLNAMDGWLGGPTAIFRTTDGGRTWQRGSNVQPTSPGELPQTGRSTPTDIALVCAVAILLIVSGILVRHCLFHLWRNV
jgi:photosystem II stability/assembly factor-like uncharacterized protein